MVISRRRRHRPAPGFSLVELLIGLAVAGLLAWMAGPVFHDWLVKYRQLSHAQALAGAMTLARSEAAKRGSRVNLCKSADRRNCTNAGGWEAGWLVFADPDDDGTVASPADIVRNQGPAPGNVTIAGNAPVANYVSYTSMGFARLRNGALQMGTFAVCSPRQRAIHVVLANSGRVRIEHTAIPCP
jgi:type IV fimbrial biogenesis protein FimT